jgi:DNA-binding NtrC family response regulator
MGPDLSGLLFPPGTLALGSPEMREVYDRALKVAPLDPVNVLLSGETGTRKEELARILHANSTRHGGAFAAIDCAALPEGLVESELFGHEAGAYTDAKASQPGLFETAQHGTFFLDEVGELPLASQVKLLRALETRRFRRVGGRNSPWTSASSAPATATSRPRSCGARSARTSTTASTGSTSWCPPLRGRHDDIERLTLFLYENLCALLRRRAQPLPDDLRAFMRDYPWPGNIRELKMAVQKLIVMTPKGESPTLDFLKRELEGHRAALPPAATTLEEAEADVALRALVASRGNKTAAAKIMGVSKPTFFRLLKKLKIEGKISLPTGVKS